MTWNDAQTETLAREIAGYSRTIDEYTAYLERAIHSAYRQGLWARVQARAKELGGIGVETTENPPATKLAGSVVAAE